LTLTNFIIIKQFFSNPLKMSNSMKNVVKVFAFMCLVLAFSCVKEDSLTDTNAVDAQALIFNELTALTANSHDIIEGKKGCGNKDGFGNMGKGHHKHPDGVKGDSIGFGDLPQAAQTILTASGDAAKILRIVKITAADGTLRYVVRLNDRKHIHFDAAGVVVVLPSKDHSFVAITIDDLPAAAKAHLLANVDSTKITHLVKITKADGTFEYSVRTSDKKHFHYDTNGAVIVKKDGKKKRKG
jgi:hypothetical protein